MGRRIAARSLRAVNRHPLAALNVALLVTGKKFHYQGQNYAFVEVATPGWALGHLPPEYDVDKAWKVIPVEVQ